MPREFAIDIDIGVCHSAIKYEFCITETLRHSKRGLVIALANPGQRARAARFLGSHILAVLLDGDHLQVPFLVKRAANGPVMGHGHRLPLYLITGELPAFTQRYLAVTLRYSRHGH